MDPLIPANNNLASSRGSMLGGRKTSIAPATSAASKRMKLEVAGEEDGLDYAPSFKRKKMSLPQNSVRANSTMQYTEPPASQTSTQPRQTTAQPSSREAIKFKKVGTLMGMENSQRSQTNRDKSKTLTGPTSNLFLRNVFNEPKNSPVKTELESLK